MMYPRLLPITVSLFLLAGCTSAPSTQDIPATEHIQVATSYPSEHEASKTTRAQRIEQVKKHIASCAEDTGASFSPTVNEVYIPPYLETGLQTFLTCLYPDNPRVVKANQPETQTFRIGGDVGYTFAVTVSTLE